jgi:hypothetical protein
LDFDGTPGMKGRNDHGVASLYYFGGLRSGAAVRPGRAIGKKD